ncbi:Bark storage protein A [Heracleum sosnowskyi]|uniref:Bark storage protein A n=1 Tax=Heracleum sosnowskyi TaxID=360622 RepID=A0AAD8MM82_9APIA|nr:Bark storage protein A [Heracleum sosnowskyi]
MATICYGYFDSAMDKVLVMNCLLVSTGDEIEYRCVNAKLNRCVNATTCLPRPPKVARVQRGASANVFVDNAAYRKFLYTKFNTTPVDMESAAVALICLQQNTPFIAFRALSDLAGGGSSVSNEVDLFSSLAAQNSVDVLIQFVTLVI